MLSQLGTVQTAWMPVWSWEVFLNDMGLGLAKYRVQRLPLAAPIPPLAVHLASTVLCLCPLESHGPREAV